MKVKKTLFTLIIGGIGGVLLGNLVLPVLVEVDFLGSASFLKIFVRPQVQTVIKETEKVVTIEPDFWKEVVPRTEKSVAFIQYFSSAGILLSQSNGIILTNDGLIAVPLNVVPIKFSAIQVFADDKILKGSLATIDAANNLALIKVETANLTILDSVDLNSLSLGQSILIVAKKIKVNKISTFAHISLISEPDGQVLFLDIERGRQRGQISGGIAVDSESKIVGMVQISNQGQVFVLPHRFLRNILEKYLSQKV